MVKNLKTSGIALLTLTSLMGCSGLMGSTQKTIKDANNAVDGAESQINNAKNITDKKFVVYNDAPYFGGTSTVIKSSSNLPLIFQNPVSIDKQFTDLNDVANTVQKLSGIPVYVDTAGQTGQGGGNQIPLIRVTQQSGGTLQDLLDTVASKSDTSWSFKDGKILLSQTETRTYTIKNLPGNLSVQNNSASTSGMDGSTGGSTGSGGGGSSSTSASSTNSSAMSQTVKFDLKVDAWSKYEDGLKSVISSIGRYSINPSNSTVTITDKPSTMIRINDYIQKQNDLMDKQVQIDVQVIAVDTQADDNYGINWNVIFKSAQGGFSINGQASGSSTGAATTGSPIFVPTGATQAFTFSPSSSSSFGGSSVLINALSSVLRTSEITNTAAITTSSQPVPINFTQQISYLASVNTTVSGTSGAGAYQTSLTPGQLSVGFSMNILPVVEGKDNIRMQIAVSISNLKAMNTFSSGGDNGSTIQLPTVNNRTFMQKVKMKSGSTFVLTGFDDSLDKIFQQGVGNATWWLFGGGYSASKTKTRMVLLVTPHLIEG